MTTTNGLIIVGLDGTPGSRTALDIALDEGIARGATVEVVTVWTVGTPYDGATLHDPETARASASAMQDRVLEENLAGRERRPVVAQTLVAGYAGPALVERSQGAAMVVVGNGRKSAVSRAFMGSTSEHLVRHAHSPVLVVPDPDRILHQDGHHAIAAAAD